MTSPLRAVWRDLEVAPTRIAASIALGSLALGSAVGLGATAAWLIARAAELPSPADLAVAAVIVRTLGIGRGLFRYLERLRSHDAALRGMASLRERLYMRLETRGGGETLAMRSGDIAARAGADIDTTGDVVVRSVVPVGVATVVSAAAVGIVAYQHLVAAAVLAAFLIAAAVLPALLTARAVRVTETDGVRAGGAVTAAALAALDQASEHRVWGTLPDAMGDVRDANRAVEKVRDRAAIPAAFAAAAQVVLQGASLVAAVWIGVAASATIGGPSATIVALMPLAAFEAVAAVAPAVTQWRRSSAAAARVLELTGGTDDAAAAPAAAPAGGELKLDGVSAAWPGMEPTRAVSARLRPGGALGIVGPSGIGKTTLLLTIAGALPPAAGTVTLGGATVGPEYLGDPIALSAEDAHVFGTTVLENLRVARGDVTPTEARGALEIVGLGPWLAARATGLDTMLGSGGNSLSGGERRRLLLARVLVHRAPIQLIDEPAEHLDAQGTDAVRAVVAALRSQGRAVVLVTHDHGILDCVDEVIALD